MSTITGDMLVFSNSGGGNSGNVYAAIVATYPSGSTCTATNGTKTLTATDTSGKYIFGIPEPASMPEIWTVSCMDGTNSDSKTITITTYGQTEEVELNYLVIGETLNETTWKNISKVSIAGTGDTYWDIGDRKAVTLNGKIGNGLTLSNTTLYVFILDFNHPINKTTADNNIIWGGFKTALTAADTSGQVVFGIPEPISTPEIWTVSCTDGTDSNSKTVSISTYGQVESVILQYGPGSVNDVTWAQISEIAQAGIGDTYWDVGDCKAITLNGTVGTLNLSNLTLYVFILDFNHPINKNTANNNIIWGGFKTALTNGVDVALYNGDTGSTDGTKIFNINHRGQYNYGGWKGCDLRYDILGATSIQPSGYTATPTTSRAGYDATAATISSPVSNTLMAALPSDLRAVLRLWDRYIDFKGNRSNTDANCSTKTVDAISLLAEFEIFGARSDANQYEQNHQKQMAYYSAGNSKVKYRHSSTSTACAWWESSAEYFTDCFFCMVNSNGTAYNTYTSSSFGVAPAFKV